jgi:hypothetical protein
VTLWLAVVAFLGAYSVFTVGVTGGPNHGEHPFLVTLVHMAAFGWRGPELPTLSHRIYWGGLLAALALGFVAMMYTSNSKAPAHWQLLTRIALGLSYAALLAVLILKP